MKMKKPLPSYFARYLHNQQHSHVDPLAAILQWVAQMHIFLDVCSAFSPQQQEVKQASRMTNHIWHFHPVMTQIRFPK